ncbi:MAG: MBL fold metallo-hydrolase [Verrucomicrobiota bacterium]
MRICSLDLQFQNHSRAIASFLVEGPEGAVLIETGPESCRETLLSELQSYGRKPEQIDAVFVTHIHLDHAGGAGWWAQQGVPVYVHPKGAKHLIDPSRLEESARMVYGERFDELWGAMVPAPENQINLVEDGQVVAVGGLEILPIETPGHCFHHHAYAVEDVLFCGDAAGARIDANEYTSVTSAPPQFHLEHTLASLQKLSDQKARTLYLTHFGEVENPDKHLEAYREAVELNATFVQQRLAEGMDAESLQIVYKAFQMEQAFRAQLDEKSWSTYEKVNGCAMCADGIRIYWEKLSKEQA